MKGKIDPFNPLPIPAELKLSENAGQDASTAHQPQQPSQKPGSEKAGQSSRPKAKRQRKAGNSSCRSETRWQRISGQLTAKLAQVDQDRLKRVLLACGVAAGIVALVILAIKLMPAAVTLLALLGLGLALQVWDRLRYQPRPF